MHDLVPREGTDAPQPRSFNNASDESQDQGSWPTYVSPETPATLQHPTLDECSEIALQPDVLGYFADALARSGVVGEERLGGLLYLALTSRLLAQPVSVAVKGPSSGGKSYSVGKVLSFFPKSAYHELSAMSEKALVYSNEPLKHRFLVLYEAAGIGSDFAEYLIRSLLSEGCLRYETVEKGEGGELRPRLIEREGPTGLLVTTTRASMHPENETRYLSVAVADTREQTRYILQRMARGETGQPLDLRPWHVFQEWLAAGRHEVEIPYAGVLVELIPPVAVRLRRDVGKLLTLIRAHALIHRASRRDDEGRIVAELRDYESVYRLVAELISTGVEASIPTTVRETVEAVAALTARQTASYMDGVSVARIAEVLGLDKSAASRRIRDASYRNYLDNRETRRGRPARVVLGDPLPEEQTILPSPEHLAAELDRCRVAPDAAGSGTEDPWS